MTFLDAASEKTLRSTVALTAARGRGKSAALGLSIAGALALDYSNIFVTAPSPENLTTLFEFILKVICSSLHLFADFLREICGLSSQASEKEYTLGSYKDTSQESCKRASMEPAIMSLLRFLLLLQEAWIHKGAELDLCFCVIGFGGHGVQGAHRL